MDIYCPICGEPYEMDSLHDEASERYGIPYYTNYPSDDPYSGYVPFDKRIKNPDYDPDAYQKVYKAVSAEFRSKGCAVFSWASPCKPRKTDDSDRDEVFGLTREEAAGALYDILGDDLDGAAVMMEDMGY